MSRLWAASLLLCLGCPAPPDPVVEIVYVNADDTAEPLSFEVSGTVTDWSGTPIQGAMVMVGGVDHEMVLTDSDGNFRLWYVESVGAVPAIVAAKIGYRARGFEHFEEGVPVTIAMRKVEGPDNEDYTYLEPGDGSDNMQENCSHCHTSFVSQFLESKHAQATKNPLVQDLYAGVSRIFHDIESCEAAGGTWRVGHEPGTTDQVMEKCYVSAGVLGDLNPQCGGEDQLACDDPALDLADQPDSYGACADCHAPGINGKAGGRNLHDAHGLAYEVGIHCDTCHKVADVDLSLEPGVGQRLVLGRPSEEGANTFAWEPVYYGPLKDVPNILMGGSYQPKFDSSVFCAGCHEQNQEALLPGQTLDRSRWPDGLPIHSTYSEWEAGPFNQEKTQCQFCHMPADTNLFNAVDIARPDNYSITFGFPREPDNIRQHSFRGPLTGENRLIDQGVYISIKTESQGDQLNATVSLANHGCGHAIPTGEPMRALILLVEAEGDCGILQASGGMTVNDVGGARAAGLIGESISLDGRALEWPEGAELARVGDIIRAVRPTGTYDDYAGVGAFGDGSLTASQKGLEIQAPISQSVVTEVSGTEVTLQDALPLQTGDRVYLGDTVNIGDSTPSRHLAGAAGYTFARVLVDAEGARQVPHYRAVDIASDNRIGPGENAVTNHQFKVPDSCSSVTLRATAVYRPLPLTVADQYGWDAVDYVISTGESAWSR